MKSTLRAPVPGWALAGLLIALPAVSRAGWPPITSREREAAADPGGSQPAVILFEEALMDDRAGPRRQAFHRRIKILTPEGLDRARVSLRFVEPAQKLVELEGRTVSPDGRETPLDPEAAVRSPAPGEVSEVLFDMPAVQVGSIVEYRYAVLGGDRPPMGGWVFQHEIPCLRSTFEWRPAWTGTSRWTLIGAEAFEPSVVPVVSPTSPDSLMAVRFEILDLPAEPGEPFGPPGIETLARLVTTYTDFASTAGDYWDLFARLAADHAEDVAADRGDIARNPGSRIAPEGDRDAAREFEMKLRSAYRHAQGFLPPEETPPRVGATAGTADSRAAEGPAGSPGAELIFMAALKSLGIGCRQAFVVDRDEAFFHRDVLSPAQFSRTLVAVTVPGGDLVFASPATRHATPGGIPWYTQGVRALLADSSGAVFATTPWDPPGANRITRNVTLRLDAGGHASGHMRMAAAGQPEIRLRSMLDEGPDRARVLLEEEWRALWPGFRIDALDPGPGESPDSNLVLEMSFRIERFARPADDRLLVPAALNREPANPFRAETRRWPVFLPFARAEVDNLVLELPREWRLENVPDPVAFTGEAGAYLSRWSSDGEHLVYSRTFVLNTPYVTPSAYPGLRSLCEAAATGDAVLIPLERVPLRPSQR